MIDNNPWLLLDKHRSMFDIANEEIKGKIINEKTR
jgi:hypothetical protein